MTDDESRLPIPVACNVCNSPNIYHGTNDAFYGKLCGEWPYIYFCKDCRASVGCHPGTNVPLGRMANSKTRRLRAMVHESFDKLWRKDYLLRKEAYDKLASFLNIPKAECHIGWLTDSQLIDAKLWAVDYLKNNPPALRRQAKKYAKELDRIARDARHKQRRKTEGRARLSRRRKGT